MNNKQKIEETNKKWVKDRCKILSARNETSYEQAIKEEWSEPQLATAA